MEPQDLPPPPIAIPLNVLEASRIKAPAQAPPAGGLGGLYDTPMQCTPSMSLAAGSRRVLASLTTLPVVENDHHALLTKAADLSRAEAQAVFMGLRAQERAARAAIGESERRCAADVAQLRRGFEALTRSESDLNAAATKLASVHERHYQRMRQGVVRTDGIFGRPRRDRVPLPHLRSDGGSSVGVGAELDRSGDGPGEPPEDEDASSVAGSSADEQHQQQEEEESRDAARRAGSEAGSGAAPLRRSASAPAVGGDESATREDRGAGGAPAAGRSGAAASQRRGEGGEEELTLAEVDDVLRQVLAEGEAGATVDMDDGTALPLPDLGVVEPPVALLERSSGGAAGGGADAPTGLQAAAATAALRRSSLLPPLPTPPQLAPAQPPAAAQALLDPDERALAHELGLSPEEVTRVQFAALKAMHRRMVRAKQRGVRMGSESAVGIATGAVARAQLEAMKNMASLHMGGAGGEQLVASMIVDVHSDDDGVDDFRWISRYSSHLNRSPGRSTGPRRVPGADASKPPQQQAEDAVETDTAGMMDALAATLLASSNGDETGHQERFRTERRLGILALRRRVDVGSTLSAVGDPSARVGLVSCESWGAPPLPVVPRVSLVPDASVLPVQTVAKCH